MNTPTPETFTDAQINDALVQFLKWGEQTYAPDENEPSVSGHKGYYNGMGWPARALRYLLAQRQSQSSPPDNYLDMTKLYDASSEVIAGLRRCVKLRKDVNALIESRSGGTFEAVSSPESKLNLQCANGYLKVRLCLLFKTKTSDLHKSIPEPEPVPELPTPEATAPTVEFLTPEAADEADLKAAQDLDSGRTVDGMVIKWARPKMHYPNTWEVRMLHVESNVYTDVDNRDLYVAIRICRTLLKARLECEQRNAANSAAQSAKTSET